MHFLSDRQKGSKVYPSNSQSITMNTDKSHLRIDQTKIQQTVNIQEKKRIDKILQSIVKERLFGNLMSQDRRVSKESGHNIDFIYRASLSPSRKISDSKQLKNQPSRTFKHYQTKSSCNHHTIDVMLNRQFNPKSQQLQKIYSKKRNFSQKLPQIVKAQRQKQGINLKGPIFHHKKLQINQKILGQFFKKFLPNIANNTILYDLKVTRQNIINKYKNVIDGKLLQRFFHFFSFPQSFGMRQYCNLIQNAANCNLKFIYFFVFSLFDEIANGVLTSQDFFKFLQKIYSQNEYIEKQVYMIQRYLEVMQKTFKPREQKQSQVPIEQIVIINHNLKLQQLIVLMKQSNKQIIDVQCLKNTCYHQSLLSIEHDPLQRIKKRQIENNEEHTNRLKIQANLAKERLKNTPGLRLRDLYAIYQLKRPKIFCYFLQLLINVKPSDYQ